MTKLAQHRTTMLARKAAAAGCTVEELLRRGEGARADVDDQRSTTMKTFPMIPKVRPASGFFAAMPREPKPPIVDHDTGDEQPRFRVQRYSTFFGEPRTCGVCFAINSVVDSLWRAHDKDHCKACRSKLDAPIALRQFTREELFGSGSSASFQAVSRADLPHEDHPLTPREFGTTLFSSDGMEPPATGA